MDGELVNKKSRQEAAAVFSAALLFTPKEQQHQHQQAAAADRTKRHRMQPPRPPSTPAAGSSDRSSRPTQTAAGTTQPQRPHSVGRPHLAHRKQRVANRLHDPPPGRPWSARHYIKKEPEMPAVASGTQSSHQQPRQPGASTLTSTTGRRRPQSASSATVGSRPASGPWGGGGPLQHDNVSVRGEMEPQPPRTTTTNIAWQRPGSGTGRPRSNSGGSAKARPGIGSRAAEPVWRTAMVNY